MIGSRSTGFACRTPSLSAIDAAILNESSFESTGWNDPSYSVALKSIERVAREHALGGRLADALLDAREEALRDRAADDLVGELDAGRGVRLELDPHVAEHAVPAGLLLVPAVGLGRAADRLAVGDRRRPGRDRGPELALEPLGDDRDVRLADRAQDLLAGVGPLDARRRLLLEHPLERRAHLVEVALGHRVDRDLERRIREVDRRQLRGRPRGSTSVSPVSVTPSFATAPISPARSSARRLLLLAVQVQQLADPLVLALGRVEDRALALERARQDAQVRQPADERVGGGLEHPDQELPAVRRDLDVLAAPCRSRRTGPPRRARGGSGRSRRAAR